MEEMTEIEDILEGGIKLVRTELSGIYEDNPIHASLPSPLSSISNFYGSTDYPAIIYYLMDYLDVLC